jgi:hypothetical protein
MRIVGLPVDFIKFSIGSKRSLLLAIAVVGMIAIFASISIFVAKRSSAHAGASSKKKQRGCCSDQPAIPRRMIGTYYTTEGGFQSTLVLNNKGPNQIMVTPILHSQTGQTFTGSLVAVGGQSSSEVDLNLLAQTAGPQFRSGNFEFTYEGRLLLEMGGGLRIVNTDKSLIFDEQMLEPGMKFPSPRLEAVYAVPFEDSQVSVIVTNTTAQPIIVTGDAIFAGTHGHHPIQAQLGPHETQVVDLPHGLVKKASAGAVSLNHNGGKGALLAKIHLQNADRGHSESVNFTSPGGKTTERHGAGLRLGSVNNDPLRPVIAIRNIGESATTVTATVPYSKQNGDIGAIELPQVSLAPGEVKLLDTSSPQLRRNDFATAGLEIRYTGAPGSVIATALSVSRSGNHVFTVPMKDPKGGLSSTGGYPWFIKESSSTVVFIKNVTDEPQQFMLSIVYPGGQWGSKIRTIDPGQTFALDMRKLRDSQEKGSDGNVIPPDATSGHVSWSYRGKRDKVLIGRAQTVDFDNGLASTYECQCPCGWSYLEGRMIPNYVSAFPGDVITYLAQSHQMDCAGNDRGWWDVNPMFFFSSSSSNPGVADWTGNGTARAFAPGLATLGVTWVDNVERLEIIVDEHEETHMECIHEDVMADSSANCDVQAPQVTDVSAQGATKVTSIVGNQSMIHFVTPKGASGEKVTLTATISPNNPESINQISWTGATQDSTNRLKATVSKESAGKTVVTIRVGGQTAKELRVWVVWATISSTDIAIAYREPVSTVNGTGASVTGGYNFTHTIQPASIITDADRPNLSGSNTVAPPGGSHWTGNPLSGGADKKWDNSRQMRTKWLLPSGLSPSDFSSPPLPNGITYPTNEVEGNDDRGTGDETNDPYANSSKLTGSDTTNLPVAHSKGSDGNTIELRLHFREFTRLEIQGTWHRISDYYLWRIHIKLQKSSGKWVNNGTDKALNNDGF